MNKFKTWLDNLDRSLESKVPKYAQQKHVEKFSSVKEFYGYFGPHLIANMSSVVYEDEEKRQEDRERLKSILKDLSEREMTIDGYIAQLKREFTGFSHDQAWYNKEGVFDLFEETINEFIRLGLIDNPFGAAEQG